MSHLNLTGIHHVTAVSGNIVENKRFYTQDLGMRLVKRTVNQDDVSAYHLFYADKIATPGTDLTFFDWPMPGETRGNHSVMRSALRVSDEASLQYWRARLSERNIPHSDITERDGRKYLDFESSEGQQLSLVADGGAGDAPTPWEESPVPPEHQLRGLDPITMAIPDLNYTAQVLEKVLNMRPVREYPDPESPQHTVHVFEMGAGGPHAELHVMVRPDLSPARLGAGGVHHVAFRTPNESEYHAWVEHLRHFGLPSSGPVDRHYFRSLYFREPNGVLFEIATDGPGFGVDEDMATLGEKTILPPFLEPKRELIMAGLKPLD